MLYSFPFFLPSSFSFNAAVFIIRVIIFALDLGELRERGENERGVGESLERFY